MEELPRVALLFITRGPMHLEPMWRMLLREAEDESLTAPDKQGLAWALQTARIKRLQRVLLDAGKYNATLKDPETECADNRALKVRTHGNQRLGLRVDDVSTEEALCIVKLAGILTSLWLGYQKVGSVVCGLQQGNDRLMIG